MQKNSGFDKLIIKKKLQLQNVFPLPEKNKKNIFWNYGLMTWNVYFFALCVSFRKYVNPKQTKIISPLILQFLSK